MKCPKCGYAFQGMWKLRKMEIETALGDLLELKDKQIRDFDDSHYYNGFGSSMSKDLLIEMYEKVHDLKFRKKKGAK